MWGTSWYIKWKIQTQHNKIIPLQYWKLTENPVNPTEEWMVGLRANATECKYEKVDRRLREQFMNDVNN